MQDDSDRERDRGHGELGDLGERRKRMSKVEYEEGVVIKLGIKTQL